MMPSIEQIPEWLDRSIQRPVGVFGGGLSGLAAKSLIRHLGGEATVFDELGKEDCETIFNLEIARAFELIIYSPGFRGDHPWICAAKEAGCLMVPEFDLGAALWRGPVIAVTGTNGKTTLVSFLNESFQHAGIESYAVGNIGSPLSLLLSKGCNAEAIAVCEVSSFQAENTSELKADHVLWTNFDEDHLDHHESMNSYFRSKYNLIVNARSESIFIGRSVYDYGKSIGIDFPESCVISEGDDIDSLGIRGSVFETRPELNTYLMARELWLALNLPEQELVDAAQSFVKSPHRMELWDKISGIRFWNDSKATNFHATLGGLSRFPEPVIWIGGGKRKGGDVGRFVQRLAPRIKTAELIGETKEELELALGNEGCPVLVHESMEAAVAMAMEKAKTGDNVVLSPGFASFDMFEGYEKRGEAFRKAVNGLKMEKRKSDD